MMSEYLNGVLKKFDSPLASSLMVAVLVSLFLFGMLHRTWNPSDFIMAGDAFTDSARVPAGFTVFRSNSGFDGQFYYRLALNPFTSAVTDYGVTLDLPASRQQRILYPLLAWCLSIGNASYVPAALLLINFFSLCLMAWAGGALAQSMKQHALFGLLLPLYPGFLLTLRCDLAEILEVSLLLLSLLLLMRGRDKLATLFLVLAVSTKESALLLAVAASLGYAAAVWKGWQRPCRWYYFTAAYAFFLLWQLVLFINWGNSPLRVNSGNLLVTPFTGFIRAAAAAAAFATPIQRRTFVELLLLAGFALAVTYCLRATTAGTLMTFSWLLYTLLAVSLTPLIWEIDWNFLRIASEWYVFGALIIIGSRSKVKAALLSAVAVLWLLQCYRLLQHIL